MNTKVLGDRLQVQRIRRDIHGRKEIIIPTAVFDRMSSEDPTHEYEVLQLGTGPMFQESNPKNLLKHVRVGWTIITTNCAGIGLPDGSRIISLFDVLAVYPLCACCGEPATCFGSYEQGPEDYACDNCCQHGNEDGHCKPIGEFCTGE